MLALTWMYLRRVAGPHLPKLFSVELLTAVGVGGATAAGLFDGATSHPLRCDEAAKLLKEYSTLGLGVCLTTLALAARWASAEFGEFLGSQARSAPRVADYGALLFKLSWTAIIHWVGVLLAAGAAVFAPTDLTLFDGAAGRGLAAAMAFVFVYAVLLFLSTVLLLSVLCVARKQYMEEQQPVPLNVADGY